MDGRGGNDGADSRALEHNKIASKACATAWLTESAPINQPGIPQEIYFLGEENTLSLPVGTAGRKMDDVQLFLSEEKEVGKKRVQ